MKKTVILAIFIAYIASIMIVQFFGLKVVERQGNVYITEIEVSGFEFTNRDESVDAKYKKVVRLSDAAGKQTNRYAGYFIPGTYDMSEESLASNPNRVKILYTIVPYNATHLELSFEYDRNAVEGAVYFDENTYEFVFLKAKTVSIIITSHDGSNVKADIGISLVL